MSLITLIAFFVILIMLGIIDVIVEIKKIDVQKRHVGEFCKECCDLNKALSNNTDPVVSISYILKHYQAISDIIGESLYKSPVLELGSAISYQNPVDPKLFVRVMTEQVEFEGLMARKLKKLKLHFFNPFILLYRGVELVMMITFGYIIQKFNPKFNSDNSIIWKVINALLTIGGSIASILAYVQTLNI